MRARSSSLIRTSSSLPIRILTAVPICDGHDSPIITINLELARHGVEVIYLGYHRSVSDIARAAIQEDVRAIGLSSYNGGHVEFFNEVRAQTGRIGLFGGGGGTITPADARLMKRRGVDEIFFAGTSLDEIVQWVKKKYGSAHGSSVAQASRLRVLAASRRMVATRGRDAPATRRRDACATNRELPRALTTIETSSAMPSAVLARQTSPVIGFTGPGGAGKTTLIDELVSRFLQARPRGRLAILSHDPSLRGHGALLADRASMIYAQDDRVFMRSVATRGHTGGLSSCTRACLNLLRHAGFDLVLVESAGIGQEDMPFGRNLVDKQVLVMSPEYGGRLQLQKLLMLEAADIVAINKSDLPAARTALSEIEQRLMLNHKGQKVISTVAKCHRDAGVDELFQAICGGCLETQTP
jgi:methylmalonyl-CoA mutase